MNEIVQKKSDLVDDLFKSGVGFEAMLLDTVIEYAEADVKACESIFLAQQEDYAKPENQSMQSVVTMMNQMLLFLVEIERNGVKIDKVALGKIEAHFRERYNYCNNRLDEITRCHGR